MGIDSAYGAESLGSSAHREGSTIGILVDIDLGMGRTGVQSPAAAVELARLVCRTKNLRFDGLMCYPGHISGSVDRQTPMLGGAASILHETIERLMKDGLKPAIVSSGSTPTAPQSHLMRDVTEIRPGTYVYNDMTIVHGGYCTLVELRRPHCLHGGECGSPRPGRARRRKQDPYERPLQLSTRQRSWAYRRVPTGRDHPAERRTWPGGYSRVPSRSQDRRRVTVIPNHICPCVNLQDSAWWQETDGSLRPLPIDARGKLV